MVVTTPGPQPQAKLHRAALTLERIAGRLKTVSKSMETQNIAEITAGYAKAFDGLIVTLENFTATAESGLDDAIAEKRSKEKSRTRRRG